jgi:transcriptional regulator with XRE-family HTH domain
MSTRRSIPPEWQKLMDQHGIGSMRQLASRAGLPHTVVSRAIHGDSKPDISTVEALADIFPPADRHRIYRLLLEREAPEAGPWTPPGYSLLLTPAQREALERLIKTMVEPEERKRPGQDPIDMEAREVRNEFYHGTRAEHALAADSNDEQGRKDRGAPAER